MSEAAIDNLATDPPRPVPAEHEKQSRFDLAQLLRWLGCAGVVLSGVVFLIQGFDDIGLALRNWAYLGLMVMLSAVGIGLKYAFADGKGARLLLGLAVAVIPIQFAQLGGMIHSLVAAAGTEFPVAVMGFLEFSAVSWGMVLASGTVTLLLAFSVGLFAFRVLARPQAMALTLVNILLCSSLLIPVREGFLAVGIFSLLAIATFLADVRLGKLGAVLRTSEGRGARLLLLLPVLIAGVRSSFYIGDIGGLAMVLGMLSASLLVGAHHYIQRRHLREFLFAMGAFGVCVAWSIWSLAELSLSGAHQALSLFAVEGLFLLAVSKFSAQGTIYRLFGSLLFGFAVLQLLFSGYGLQASVSAMVLGVMLGAIGYFQKWRMPALVGVMLIAVAIVPLTLQAVFAVEFGTWVGLALGGVSLVVLGSLVDRYGRTITRYAHTSWVEVKAWD